MANQADVELRIRSRDLSKKDIEGVTKGLEALNAMLREQRDAAKIAATSVKQLKDQQKLLGDAAANLNARRGDIDALQRQQAEIAQTVVALNKYRRELAELRTIQRSGNFLGDIDKAIKNVGQSVTSSSRLLDKQRGAFDRASERAREYGVDLENLGGSLKQVESLQEQVAAALNESSTAFDRRETALKDATAAQQRQEQATRDAAAAEQRLQQEIADSIRFEQQRDAVRRQARVAESRAGFEEGFAARDAAAREAAAQRQVVAAERVIGVNRRADAVEARLAATRGKSAGFARQLAQANERLGQSQRRQVTNTRAATEEQRRLNNQTRTALSFNQRLRGQVLSIAAAYFGVFEAINTVSRAINTDIERQGTMMRLEVAAGGDVLQAGKDFEYVREQADRLGQRLEPLAAQYSKFAIAAQGAGQSLDTTREVFENFTEVGTVLQLSQENLDGIFKALEQSFSKGIIQAEELRGQLGDRLPGAFTKLAKAIGISNGELTTLMENGELTADVLPLLGEFMADEVAGALPEAMSNTRAELGRLRTALDDFLVSLSHGGLGDAVRSLSIQLREFFSSQDGKQFAEDLAISFRTAVNALGSFISVLGGPGGVIALLKLLVAVKIASWAGQWAVGVGAMIRQLALMRTGMMATGAAARTMGARLMGALGPIGIALALATEAFFYFKLKADAAADAAEDQAKRVDELRTAHGRALQAAVAVAEQDLELAKASKEAAVEKRDQARATLENARAQLAELKAQGKFTERAGFIRGEPQTRLSPEARRLATQYQEAQEAIESAEAAIGDFDKTAASAAFARERLRTESWSAEAAALKEFAALEAELADETNQKKFISDKKYYDDLNDRARKAFAALGEASREYVKQSTLDAQEALQGTLGQLRAQRSGIDLSRLTKEDGAAKKAREKAAREEKRAADERQRLAEKAAEELKRIDHEVLEANADNVEGRLALLDFEMDEREANLLELQRKLQEAAAQAKGVEAELLRQQAAKAGTAAARFGDGGDIRAGRTQEETEESSTQSIQDAQQAVNDIIAVRDARIEAINAKVEAGLISEIEGQNQILEQRRLYAESIQESIRAVLTLLAAIEQSDPDLAKKLNIEQIRAEMQAASIEAGALQTKGQQLTQQFREDFASGVTEAFGAFASGIADAIKDTGSLSDAFKAAGDAFLNFAADFLIEIGRMILMQALLNALQNSSGGFGGFVAGLMGAGKKHTGGMIGGASFGSFAQVSPLAFIGAPRYHNGGFPGLRSDEVPIIAQRGEEMLSRTDPRNAMNGGAATKAPDIKIVNAIDSASVVNEAMNRRDGQQPVINMIRARRAEIKQILGVG